MRTLIYQYWYGKDMENCAKYGKEVMSAYAKRIGAEYRFDRNPTFFDCICEQPISFSCLMPVFNPEFHKYDAVLSVDMDMVWKKIYSKLVLERWDYVKKFICQL